MNRVRLSYQFAIRDRKTKLFWDGGHCPPYFGVNYRGDPTIGVYTRASENWKLNWSITPTLFDNEEYTRKLILRYLVDAECFPKGISTDLEIVRFQITTTRNYLASDELGTIPYSIDKNELMPIKIHLCLGNSFYSGYLEFISFEENDRDQYQYACRLRTHIINYTQPDQKLFDYEYHRGILFLKTASDLMLAQLLIGNDLTNAVNLSSFGPSFIDEESDLGYS